jgi:hypothetical protein
MLATPEALENRLRRLIELIIAASGTAKNVKR